MTDDGVMADGVSDEVSDGVKEEVAGAGATVVLSFWAGARAAAGTDRETHRVRDVAEALQRARVEHDDPHFSRVLALSSLLIEGRVVKEAELARPLPHGSEVVVEVLPPFAGGSSTCWT